MTSEDQILLLMPETILVFDSGLGGTTVLREIVKLRPGARYVYVADDAYFPYGQHTEAEIGLLVQINFRVLGLVVVSLLFPCLCSRPPCPLST